MIDFVLIVILLFLILILYYRNSNIISTNRYEHVDVAKGIGIVLVVWAHVGLKGSGAINIFHMSLFFLLSGYLFKNDVGFKEYLKKKLKGLYFPFICYEVLFLVLHNLFVYIGMYSEISFMDMGKNYGISDYVVRLIHVILFDNFDLMLAPLWFVTALFFAELIWKGINSLIKKDICRYIIGICFLIVGLYATSKGKIIVNVSYNFDHEISVIFIAVFFIMLGQLLHKYENLARKLPLILNVLIGVVSLIIVCLFSINGMVCDFRKGVFMPAFSTIACSILGVAAIYLVSVFLVNIKKGGAEAIPVNFLSFLGRNSFVIMALQFLGIKIVMWLCIMYKGLDRKRLGEMFFYDSSISFRFVGLLAGIGIPLFFKYCANYAKKYIDLL